MSTITVPDQKSTIGSAGEFEQVFQEHSRLIYRTAFGVTGSPEDAEDILQTIFLRLLRREFPPDLKKSPKAYLYRAAVNLSLDTMRSRRRRVLVEDEEQLEKLAVTDSSSSDLHDRLYGAMAELSPDAAQALILRHVHNYTDAEIAKMLGTSRTVVAVRLFRSRARLRKLLRGENL
jgi:RNA polymerase sigma-70 factor (ECF subfamily)